MSIKLSQGFDVFNSTILTFWPKQEFRGARLISEEMYFKKAKNTPQYVVYVLCPLAFSGQMVIRPGQKSGWLVKPELYLSGSILHLSLKFWCISQECSQPGILCAALGCLKEPLQLGLKRLQLASFSSTSQKQAPKWAKLPASMQLFSLCNAHQQISQLSCQTTRLGRLSTWMNWISNSGRERRQKMSTLPTKIFAFD